MPLSPEETAQRRAELVQMQAETKKHNIKLMEFSQRFKCQNQEAFNVMQGIDLESPLRDKMYAYLCGEPGKGLRPGHGLPAPKPVGPSCAPGYSLPAQPLKVATPAAPPEEPHKPVVVNLLVPSRKEREAARAAEAAAQPPAQPEAAIPPKPDPVPPVVIEERKEPAPAAPTPPPQPVSEPAKVTTAPPAKKHGCTPSDPEVGERIRAAIQAAGHTNKTIGLIIGHKNGTNVCTALGKAGSRSLQIRLCDLLALDHQGHPIPGKAHKLPPPRELPSKPAAAAPVAKVLVKMNAADFGELPGPGKNASTAEPVPPKPFHLRVSDHNRAVGTRIRRIIEERGYTVRQVAWHLGHQNAGNVAACLKGRHAPDLQKRLCDALDLDASGNPTYAEKFTMPPAAEIRPPDVEIDPAKIVSRERAAVISDALAELGESSAYLKAADQRYKEAQERYKKALREVQRLGISSAALRAA